MGVPIISNCGSGSLSLSIPHDFCPPTHPPLRMIYSVAEGGPVKDMEEIKRWRPSQGGEDSNYEEEEEEEAWHPRGGAHHRRRWTSLGFSDSQMESTEGSDGGSSGVKVEVKVNSDGEGEGGGRWRSLLLHSETTAAELFLKPSSPLWTGGAVPFLWEETPGKSKHLVAKYIPPPPPPTATATATACDRSKSHPYNAPLSVSPHNNNPYNSSLRLPPRLIRSDAPTPRTSSKLRLIKKLSVSYGRLLTSSSSSSSFYSSHHRKSASFSGSLSSHPENNNNNDDNNNCDTLLLFSPSEDGLKKPNSSSASSASSSSSSSSLPYIPSDKSFTPLTPRLDHPKFQLESPTAMEKKRRSSFRSWMANLISCGRVKIPNGERSSHPLPELIA